MILDNLLADLKGKVNWGQSPEILGRKRSHAQMMSSRNGQRSHTFTDFRAHLHINHPSIRGCTVLYHPKPSQRNHPKPSHTDRVFHGFSWCWWPSWKPTQVVDTPHQPGQIGSATQTWRSAAAPRWRKKMHVCIETHHFTYSIMACAHTHKYNVYVHWSLVWKSHKIAKAY